ncbi:hypothetical protein ACQKH1_07885 [Staphylococcus capitis]|uniref:hypothetical protein n=1 Tax=Staphylococcus capitis TaxID=29388 RepID=UPI003CFF83C3
MIIYVARFNVAVEDITHRGSLVTAKGSRNDVRVNLIGRDVTQLQAAASRGDA